jgi:dTDP-4-dehydrorhamnose reductase
MRALIVGATGLHGHALYRHLRVRPGWEVSVTTYDIAVPGFERLDAMDAGAVDALLARLRPDAVIFPASNPFVDYCERHPEETRRLNVEATLRAARAAQDRGARFVFFSTDYVFDGTKGSAYREEDEPRPLNEYGRQKLEVERALADGKGRWTVVRTSAIYGWELQPKNFIVQVLAKLKSAQRLRAAFDLDYTPTYAPSLAEGIAGLVEKDAQGLFHLAGPEKVSRAEFAREAAMVFGLDADLIEAAPFAAFAGQGAARPQRSPLDSGKAARLLGQPLLGAREGLKAMKAAAGEWEEYSGKLLSGGGLP